jgi:hypothetical protein
MLPYPRVRARSSAEEHYLDMVGVTGSIPVAPTINDLLFLGFYLTCPFSESGIPHRKHIGSIRRSEEGDQL